MCRLVCYSPTIYLDLDETVPHNFLASFIQTNQTSFLDASSANLPGIVSGMQKICALESTLLGNVSSTDGETTPTSSGTAATATTTTNGASSFSSSLPWSAVVVGVLSSLVAALL